MLILQHSALFSPTPPPVPILLLPAPPKRLALPAPQSRLMLSAPKIGGYLPASHQLVPIQRENRVKRVVEAEIANPLLLIDIRRNRAAWWEEFERIYGPSKTTEELDAEIEAKHPGYMAWVARQQQREAARS